MTENKADPTNDIEALHSALTALVAERCRLGKCVVELERRLESNPPADRDLRERLVCAIWPVLIQQWREYKDAIDPRGDARSDALEEADKMHAAMRKGEQDAN